MLKSIVPVRLLYKEVEDVLLAARARDPAIPVEADTRRRRRAFKYSPRERLYWFLLYMKEYPTFRAHAIKAHALDSIYFSNT